jgi:Raf kinase inhibitor-like YbhB/YbcL family protein
MLLKLSSSAFKPKGSIPKENACDGADVSPALSWSGAPKGTASFALIMEDPDAPAGVWVHWVVYDIPAGEKGLAAAAPKADALPDGARHGLAWGVNAFDRVGYSGPCPPPGKPHRYVFTLFALDKKLNLPARKPKPELVKAMEGHILAQAELIGLYGR